MFVQIRPLMLGYILTRSHQVLRLPQVSRAAVPGPNHRSAVDQACGNETTRCPSLEIVHDALRGLGCADHDVDVIAPDIEGVQCPITVLAYVNDGPVHDGATVGAEEHGWMFQEAGLMLKS